jgi:hypothetical protein
MNQVSHNRGGLARRQLLQGNGPQHHPDWLNPGPQKLADGLLIFLRQMKFDGAS